MEFKALMKSTQHKTVMLGIVKEFGKDIIKYLIRKEIDNMYSVYESRDNGYSARLLPRLNTVTAKECYHESIEAAKEWIENHESDN